MRRRDFLKHAGCAVVGVGAHAYIPFGASPVSAESYAKFDRTFQLKLADMALDLARRAGAGYADVRVGRDEQEFVFTREERVELLNAAYSLGFGVRVLVNGSWGFAASDTLGEEEVKRVVALAIENAQANSLIQATRIVLEDLPAYQQDWTMPMKIDPFTIPPAEKAAKLLSINAAALKAGAQYCSSTVYTVREERAFASSNGSRINQSRVRCHPSFDVTAIDKQSGKFASRASLAAPRGSGWEYFDSYDFAAEATLAAGQARQKLAAKPVEPRKYDLVLDPAHMWLTIHETVGHSTELDRALGWEANYAGTSFVTPDKLGKLQFGSPLMTVMADRSQEGGLATVAFDDDGVRTAGLEFPIIEKGVFQNYQMAIGQAQFIGRERSNGCAYCAGSTAFPIQRMPNISLQPNPAPASLDDLIADVKDGIYIVGAGSWSIDQQRYNFQFGGQLFYEIKDGKRGEMLRDVAYQGNTLEFWNALDGLGDKSTYFLGGTFNCGKGQPSQGAPVSHGAVPARFRQIDVLNTERKDI
jgi:TldD protein